MPKLTLVLDVSDETVKRARAWERRNRYNHDDLASCVAGYILTMDSSEADIDECHLDGKQK